MDRRTDDQRSTEFPWRATKMRRTFRVLLDKGKPWVSRPVSDWVGARWEADSTELDLRLVSGTAPDMAGDPRIRRVTLEVRYDAATRLVLAWRVIG